MAIGLIKMFKININGPFCVLCYVRRTEYGSMEHNVHEGYIHRQKPYDWLPSRLRPIPHMVPSRLPCSIVNNTPGTSQSSTQWRMTCVGTQNRSGVRRYLNCWNLHNNAYGCFSLENGFPCSLIKLSLLQEARRLYGTHTPTHTHRLMLSLSW